MLDYGCWCRIRNEYGGIEAGGIVPGLGTPVDALDEACKTWHQCKACTSIDFQSCNPNDVYYEIAHNPNSKRLTCSLNSEDCSVSNHTFCS